MRAGACETCDDTASVRNATIRRACGVITISARRRRVRGDARRPGDARRGHLRLGALTDHFGILVRVSWDSPRVSTLSRRDRTVFSRRKGTRATTTSTRARDDDVQDFAGDRYRRRQSARRARIARSRARDRARSRTNPPSRPRALPRLPPPPPCAPWARGRR